MSVRFDAPVIIIGGGPVGLGMALDLSCRGQRSILLEKDPGTALVMLAKANGLNERTCEIFRRWGLLDRIAEVGFPEDHPGDTVYCTSLTGFYLGRSPLAATRDEVPPEGAVEKRRRCPQYQLDRVMADAVLARGMTAIRYGTAFESLSQDSDGVTVRARDVESGDPVTLRARYAVACDGAGSAVRRSLGIEFPGELLDFSLSAMVRVAEIDFPHELAGGERYILVDEGGTWGIFTSIDGHEIWRITLVGSQDRFDSANYDIGVDIRRALGSDIPFEIIRIIPWRRSQCVAEQYRLGRVLIAGDAAHTMSPTGGHGLNTGLGDVTDLSWMLDATLSGWSGDQLLSAYEIERKPIAIRNGSAATANYRGWSQKKDYSLVRTAGAEADVARRKLGDAFVEALHSEWNSSGVALGYRYEHSPIICPDGTREPEDRADHAVVTARPGHRAPHVALADGGSTIDLFGNGFVLLRLQGDQIDVRPLQAAAEAVGLPLSVVDIDEQAVLDVYRNRLVLVRPDGHVAWRSDAPPEDPGGLIDIIRGAASGSVLPKGTGALACSI